MKKSVTKLLAATALISCMMGICAHAEWQKDETGWRYQYASKGYARDGKAVVEGASYVFDKHGYMQTGWQYTEGKWYYADPETGVLQGGWLFVDGNWYYMDPDFYMMRTGWLFLGDQRYYLNANTGELVIGEFAGDDDDLYFQTDETGAVISQKYYSEK